MDTLKQLVRYALAIGAMVPLLGMALLVGPFSQRQAWRLVRSWNRLVLALFGIQVDVRYDGNAEALRQGGIIVGLTQQSLIDPTVGFASWDLPVKGVWNIEYALIPFVGWVSVCLGWVIIRQNPAQAKRQLGRAAAYARAGGLVYLSAEGRRSDDGGLSPYKKGPVVLAIQAQAPIHPVYIAGSRACLAPGQWKIRPGRIVIHYTDPLPTAGLGYDDREALLLRLRAVGEATHRRWSGKGGRARG
ncbi:1-acyl-sn-glycerol-3-phosphate acyltransferase [Alcanivorax hongdengensis A-11-3]|uniref:1-acyl-sn-glycerol-3-phosphate acyltransferase n=1 Tax=Alcanivorax hongdengensis A-11-3 TaxID=1177179 RepID=L0WDA2_9GAMM|nr:lysophospholipid acyltransferase family protein [Alcanivorax hongdengensis]EKF73750.1 1-acyl-sn-glycerol-3-phosphate acyltransferase [Alcanivorax hongdengensis A-11-3]